MARSRGGSGGNGVAGVRGGAGLFQTTRNPATHQGQWFALDTEVLRTSMLVVGPPGSGKTRSFARPIIEMLGLQALVGLASVVVIDPTGNTFGPDILPGFFDVDIDPTRPPGPDSWGFDLFGGAQSPEEAADRVAGAVLPPDTGVEAGAHHGIVGMRERTAMFGGTLIAEPRREGGFEVRARLPIDPTSP